MDEEDDDIEIVMEEAPVDNYQKPITVISTGKETDSGDLADSHGDSVAEGGPQHGSGGSTGEGRGQDAGRSTITKTLAISGHLDMSAILYEGKSIFNVDLDSFEDKPWRKPGVDMTDYFNYGFDENLWRLYCQKQKALRDDNLAHRKLNIYESTAATRSSSVQAPRYGFESSTSGSAGIPSGPTYPLSAATTNGIGVGPRTAPFLGSSGGPHHPFPPPPIPASVAQGSALPRPPMPPPPSMLPPPPLQHQQGGSAGPRVMMPPHAQSNPYGQQFAPPPSTMSRGGPMPPPQHFQVPPPPPLLHGQQLPPSTNQQQPFQRPPPPPYPPHYR